MSLVEKFELTEEEYLKRPGTFLNLCVDRAKYPDLTRVCPDTVRAYKERHKLGRFSDEAIAQMAELERKNKEAAESIKVGDRCEVQLTEDAQMKRRGTVRFIGKLSSTQ